MLLLPLFRIRQAVWAAVALLHISATVTTITNRKKPWVYLFKPAPTPESLTRTHLWTPACHYCCEFFKIFFFRKAKRFLSSGTKTSRLLLLTPLRTLLLNSGDWSLTAALAQLYVAVKFKSTTWDTVGRWHTADLAAMSCCGLMDVTHRMKRSTWDHWGKIKYSHRRKHKIKLPVLRIWTQHVPLCPPPPESIEC